MTTTTPPSRDMPEHAPPPPLAPRRRPIPTHDTAAVTIPLFPTDEEWNNLPAAVVGRLPALRLAPRRSLRTPQQHGTWWVTDTFPTLPPLDPEEEDTAAVATTDNEHAPDPLASPPPNNTRTDDVYTSTAGVMLHGVSAADTAIPFLDVDEDDQKVKKGPIIGGSSASAFHRPVMATRQPVIKMKTDIPALHAIFTSITVHKEDEKREDPSEEKSF